MSNVQKRACRNSLQMLHDVNCVHNDIRCDNFIIRKSASGLEEAIIIDYGFSFITDKKESLEKEMNELKSQLGEIESIYSPKLDSEEDQSY